MILPKLFSRFRSVVRTSVVLLLVIGSHTYALAAPPSQPGNLRHLIYSNTSTELFWDRPATIGLTYEIKRNGIFQKTTDGVSYNDKQLIAGTTYAYQVVAINPQGERSTPATVSVNTQAIVTPAQPTSAVAAPAGLRASVYSLNSAELFWNRPTTVGLTYEIQRDGKVVKTTDGVSFYDNQLSAGTTFAYQVIAIDRLGVRSTPSTLSISTKAGSTPVVTQPTQPTQPSTSIAAPAGLRASVYSVKSAELFWNRPTTVGLTYEIQRDGKVIKTTDGVSFYDNQLSAGTTYTYQVVAIDAQGRRSPSSGVMLNTQVGTTPIVTPPVVTPPVVTPPVVTPPDESTPITFALSKAPVAAIAEPANYYQRNGYGNLGVIRIDVKTVTTPGTCKVGDLSGCTLADVLADTDKRDELDVDIAVHFKSDDFADDGSVSNATMRLRGTGSRFGAQKSFRIKLDSKDALWRNERFVQLNKSPFDSSRMRNKLAFDVMSEIPHMPSIRTQFVNLWIDDGKGPVDQGLYHHVERINENYLINRGFDAKGNIYDAQDFTFEATDLSDIAIDAQGAPKNKVFFEGALGISAGTDHRNVVAMLTALHNPNRSFVSVLDQYFDRNNVMTWMAVNILLNQYDAVRHNYYLYNPAGSEKFYFIPWDYDSAMGTWPVPPNNFESDSLRQRLDFGYGVGEPNVFISRFLRLPGMHKQMTSAVDYIRQNYLTDQSITEKAAKYIKIVEPYQTRAPDNAHNPWFKVSIADKFSNGPAENVQALKSRFSIPMPPTLYKPVLQGSDWRFTWKPAYDVTGNSVSYELQVSSNPAFRANDLVVNIKGIKDAANIVEQRVDGSQLRSGTYYARLIARAANEPEQFWQISLNRLDQDGARYYGVLRFSVP